MDKEGFILPDMNITPNDRKPTIQTDSMTLHISPPEFIDTPWPTPRLGTSFDPFSRDYNRSDIFGINANSYLSTYSLHNTYPTMGTHIQVGAIYTYAPNERWELSGGLFSAKYTMPSFQHGARNDLVLAVRPLTGLIISAYTGFRRIFCEWRTKCFAGVSHSYLSAKRLWHDS